MAKISIRKARATDASNLYRLIEEVHAESPLYPPVDEAMLLGWITGTSINGYVIVADLSGRLIGSLALSNYQFPWAREWYLSLEWLAIHKRFRAEGAFDALMAAAHAYADELNAPILAGITAGGDNVYAKERLMRTKRYTQIGGYFIRSASNGISERRWVGEQKVHDQVHSSEVG